MAIVFAPIKILDEIAGDLYASVKKIAGVTKDAFIRNLELGFSNYLSNKYERYSKVHTLLSPHDPVNIQDIYVNPNFSHNSAIVIGSGILDFILSKSILVVQAIAGHGKSMLLREVFCRLCKLNYGVIPIFLELRDIDFEKSDILDTAYGELAAQSPLFSKSAFDELVRTGKILFLLDGFDEVKTGARKIALKKIDQLTRSFPLAKVVVTSRPTDIFNGWGPATIVSISDYDLSQIIELVEKSPIGGEVRDAFRARVEQDYIKTHSKFLANPLLCNMMILTFMKGGDIPRQKHIFYRKAFETLFRHHDDMKFLYKRDYHSDLSEDIFIRLWRGFCYFSYLDRKFGFDFDQLKHFIEKSAAYLTLSVDAKAIANDFIESLCIIVKDGEHYSFLHRSFQEYATATFLVTERVNNLGVILDRINDYMNDEVIDLALLSNKEKIEQEYILPRLDNLIRDFRRLRSTKKKALLFYSAVSLDADAGDENRFYFSLGVRGAANLAASHLALFLRRNYRTAFDHHVNDEVHAWLKRQLRTNDQNNRHTIEIEFEKSLESFLTNSPIKKLVNSYCDGFVKIRDEIVDRRKHQNQMLKL